MAIPQGGYTEGGYDASGASTTTYDSGATASSDSYYSSPTYASSSSSGGMSFILGLVGIVLFLVGLILKAILYKIDDNDAMENLMMLYEIFIYIGVALVSIGMLHGGLMNENLNSTVRTGMLVAVALMVGLVAANAITLGLGGLF